MQYAFYLYTVLYNENIIYKKMYYTINDKILL